MLDTQSPFADTPTTDAVGLTERKLRGAILSGGLTAGIRLSEIDLCRDFGQGRGIIRAVLAKLAHAGFVVSQPRSGWRVSAISAAGLREIIMARSRLESLLAEATLSAGELTSIRTICDMQAALRSAPLIISWEHRSLHRSYDRQIREILVAKLKAPLIADWLGNAWDKSERYLNYFDRTGAKPAPWFDWRPFIEAKSLGKDEDAASLLNDGCAAFALFAQASLLNSDLVAPEAAQRSKATRLEKAQVQETTRRREQLPKGTI